MKRKYLIVLGTCLLATGALISCGEKPAPTPVTVESVALKGLSSAYALGSTIDWSNYSLEVTYSDKHIATIEKANIELDVTAAANETTTAIINTAGTREAGATSQIKDYEIKAVLKEDNWAKTYTVSTIHVQDYNESNSKLYSFTQPQFVSEYKANVAAAGQQSEASFYKADELFTVGHLNAFKVMPIVALKVNGSEQLITTDAYQKDVKIYNRKTDGTKGDLLDSSLYSVSNSGIDFDKGAIGKSLILEVKPATFTKDFSGKDIAPFTFDFKVESGINIYDCKELAAINLTKLTRNDFSTTRWCRHIGNNIAVDYNDGVDFFYNKDTNTWGYAFEPDFWLNYIKKNNIFTAEQIEDYKDAEGYFFMNNLTFNESCVPDEYLISKEEALTQSGKEDAAGRIRDGVALYQLMLNVPKTVNGNYFTFNANELKTGRSSEIASDRKIYTNDATQVNVGRAAIFEFDGITWDNSMVTQIENPAIKLGTIKNINATGNATKRSEQEALFNVASIRFAQAKWTGANFNNLIIKQFLFGVGADISIGSGNTEVDQFDTTFVKDCKIYDCANSAIYAFQAGGLNISHCEMKRFGGSVLLQLGNWPEYTTEPSFERYQKCNVTVKDDCIMEAWVTGEEAYFKSLGPSASQLVAMLDVFNTIMAKPVDSAGVNRGLKQDGRYNLINIAMSGVGIASDKPYYANFKLEHGEESLNLNGYIPTTPTGDEQPGNLLYYGLKSDGNTAPVVSSSKGDVFFIDPVKTMACLKLNGATPEPYGEAVTADYLGLLLPIPTGIEGVYLEPMAVTFGLPPITPVE